MAGLKTPYGKPLLLRKPIVFLASYKEDHDVVLSYTFGSIISPQPKTWILPLSLLQERVFDLDVDMDCNYINLSLSDFLFKIATMTIKEIYFNLNDDVIIFPNPSGWKKIISDIMKAYQFDEKKAKEWAEKSKTEDGGYKEQLWEIISMHHDMFFNGTTYFKTVNIILCNEN